MPYNGSNLPLFSKAKLTKEEASLTVVKWFGILPNALGYAHSLVVNRIRQNGRSFNENGSTHEFLCSYQSRHARESGYTMGKILFFIEADLGHHDLLNTSTLSARQRYRQINEIHEKHDRCANEIAESISLALQVSKSWKLIILSKKQIHTYKQRFLIPLDEELYTENGLINYDYIWSIPLDHALKNCYQNTINRVVLGKLSDEY